MSTQLLLGTYTRRVSEGIYSAVLNPVTNQLDEVTLLAEVGSPTYLDTNEDKSIIYSVISENDKGGIVTLVKQDDGTYKRHAELVKDGASPCYVAFDANRQYLYTSNYHNGEVAVYKTDVEGNLELLDMVAHTGSSVHENQGSPHVHYSDLSPDGNFVIVCDLGTDELYTYEVTEEGKLEEVVRLKVAPGTGPRHIAFSPTLEVAYLFGELSNDVLVLDYNPMTGEFTEKQTISTIPEDHTGFNGGAAIRVSSDGQFVYASNRGHDSIVVYKADEDGKLTLVGYTPTEGETPRDFNFDETENYLIVGHQDSDNLSLFERNQEDGTLTLLQKDVEAPEVVCVAL
ncbi:6-phosphogluconolactonase [Atopostipes suicloacalis DSM 15692]|uniref:6-phosphogluconolactonase n=1 Tax=Atopostipes suicloacalis DSM 15692 TaxID=1121025 RepID=A0A1M4U8D9_9LACT|nr:lactonase family protein [Atopostipes suicloacalis]SHE52944.1 6-phosphogluconolactonase [Atopostipes suicloacalis DSM 15692]